MKIGNCRAGWPVPIGLSAHKFWPLVTPCATITGLFTNATEGGSTDSVQPQWVTNEFATAPTDRALLVALHHLLNSFDDHRSGSSQMVDIIESAIRGTGRGPNLVLSSHVYDYQRIVQKIAPGSPTPFIVRGNRGLS